MSRNAFAAILRQESNDEDAKAIRAAEIADGGDDVDHDDEGMENDDSSCEVCGEACNYEDLIEFTCSTCREKERKEKEDEENEDHTCGVCGGCGEGQYEGTRCHACGGKGEKRPARDYDDYDEGDR